MASYERMARHPAISTAGAAVPASIFARLREHLARYRGDVIPLQIGDTHLPPPAGMHDEPWAGCDDLYAYGAPGGWAPLVAAIIERARRRGVDTSADGVQVAVGATHALTCAVQAVCDPGDELALMTPHWPLIRGIALAQHVVPVEVPYDEPALAITPRTTAIYFATPNNPDGAMLDRRRLEAIAALAQAHDLWILADEVYEHYGYDAEHVAIASLPAARERTISVYSFAKSYAQAGLRVGYAIAPPSVTATMRKLVNHSVYNVPVASQRAGLRAIERGDGWLAATRERYRAARDRALARLHAPAARPPGGAYLWVDLRRWGADCMPTLANIAEAGVLLAPGHAFGDGWHGFARLCFTGVDEARLDDGIDRINAVLDRM